LLRGYVELCYDLNHNPSFRLLESLLYHSNYCLEIEASQSFELSEAAKDGARPFMLSTPRLCSNKSVSLPLPFSSQAMDILFQMRRIPTTYHKLRDTLAIEIENEPLFKTFFTTTPPRTHTKYDGKGFRLRYFGHACLLIESAKTSILIDPIISYGNTGELPRFTYDDLPEEIDYLLITHSHHDHIVPETLLQLRTRVKTIVVGRNYDGLLQDPSLQLILTKLGFPQVVEIRDMQEITIPNGVIMGIPFLGEHHDLLMQSKNGYFIRIDDSSLLCIADSCNFEPELYQHVARVIGMVDMLFLGMECDGASPSWLYGPLFPQSLPREINRSRRARGSNFTEACSLLNIFKFKQVYIYAMGQEPWLSHILDNQLSEESNSVIQFRQLLAECGARGIVAEYLFGKKEIHL
jgi:L-ascorbate metabolism protein UlaG (beta-lactamase superfamily)